MKTLGVLLLAGLAMAQAPTYQEIASTKDLMQGLIDPASRAIRDSAKEQGPQDDRAWRTAMLNGVMLQESAQLLKMGSRAKDQDAWIKACQGLTDAGAAVQKAAQAKDLAALQAAATGINASCQGCHSVFRQRGQKKQ
jgi:cytochrome c556